MVQIVCDNHEPIEVELSTSDTVWTNEKTVFQQCRKCGCPMTDGVAWLIGDPVIVREYAKEFYAEYGEMMSKLAKDDTWG